MARPVPFRVRADLGHGFQRIQARLDQLAEAGENLPIQEIAEYMVRSTRNRISQQKRAPSGRPWAPLAAATVRDRLRQGYSAANILMRSRRLHDSVHVEDVTDRSFRIVVDPVDERGRGYARFHQTGTRRMPARPIVGYSDRNIQEIRRRINRHLGFSGIT